jgi:hypothetical protein
LFQTPNKANRENVSGNFNRHKNKQTMKRIFNLVIGLSIVLTSCNPSKTEKVTLFPDNTLFSITPTTDPTYCNADSVVGTDCGIGDIYLTKEGNVLYSPFCMGMDTFTYYIGKYNISDTGIVCSFNSEYSYYLGCDGCPEEETNPVNANLGKIRGGIAFTLVLKSTNCKDFPYSIANAKDEDRQGLRIEADKNDYCQTISEIKALSEFHCAFNPQKKETTVNNKMDDDIIKKISLYYGRQNLKSIPKIEETDSVINLSFTEISEDELATPYSNISISKIKSDYLFGDLNNDGKIDVVASVWSNGGGSATWVEYVTFISEDNQYMLKSVTRSFDLAICNGGSHDGQFYPKEIKDGVINGTSVCYTDKDAHCCPSIKKESRVVFKKDKLVKAK